MFGLNDNNTQTANNNHQAGDAPAGLPPNPFSDSQAPAPTAQTTVPEPVSTPFTMTPAMPPEPSLNSQAPAAASPHGDDLLDLKQQALHNLQPLVSHLEQTPEEKFKTTMMLIQATDNSALVKQAYDAAQQIPDEKARAQALLDVVNEINYFTQHANGAPEDKA